MNDAIVFGALFVAVMIGIILFIKGNDALKKRVREAKAVGFPPDLQAKLDKVFKQTKWLMAITAILVPISLVLLVARLSFHQRHFGLGKYEPDVFRLGTHSDVVSGVINNAFYEEIKRLSASGVHTFVINSPGGDYDAAKKIVKTINRNNDKVLLYGGQCASSCVYVFAFSKNHAALYDAEFLFHGGYIGWDTARDRIRRALYTVGIGPKLKVTPRLMLSWAAHISPRLKSYLVSCHPDISTTHKGLWLSWEQIHFIDKGVYKMSCDAVMQKETSQWRAGIMSNMVYGIKHGEIYGWKAMPHQTLYSSPKDVHTGS